MPCQTIINSLADETMQVKIITCMLFSSTIKKFSLIRLLLLQDLPQLENLNSLVPAVLVDIFQMKKIKNMGGHTQKRNQKGSAHSEFATSLCQI